MDAMQVLERAFIRDRALSREILDDEVRSVYGYVFRLLSSERISCASGRQIETASLFAKYRDIFGSRMRSMSVSGVRYPQDAQALNGVGTLAWHGEWHRRALVSHYPEVRQILGEMIAALRVVCPELCPEDVTKEFQRKRLVLALGGGGGTGYAHMCLFQLLSQHGICPALITGTSFGALAGYLRAMQVEYDAAMTMLRMPGYWRILKDVRPCLDTGKHGLMGMIRLDFNDICVGFSQAAGYTEPPPFSALPIPFACVSTGILRNAQLENELTPKTSGRLERMFRLVHPSWQHAMAHASQIARLILRYREAVTCVPLGFDAQTRDITAADGVAFSALVPGVINAEIPANHVRSREGMARLFESRGLYRLADGGLTSNVPVRTARDEVQRGRLGSRCIWLEGIDVFAPQARDGIFYPLQQIANDNVLEDAAQADSLIRLKDLFSPMELSASLRRMHWLNAKFREAFSDEMRVIAYAVSPLLPLSALPVDAC